jgi:hypothetical protein
MSNLKKAFSFLLKFRSEIVTSWASRSMSQPTSIASSIVPLSTAHTIHRSFYYSLIHRSLINCLQQPSLLLLLSDSSLAAPIAPSIDP